MSAMQRRKGASYEREVANRLRAQYPEARRGLSQPRNGSEVPDVEGCPWWVEAKHRQRVNVRAALEQAEADRAQAGSELPPLAVCRDNGRRDLVALYLDDFLALLARGAR
jgi:hypothetical protein